METYALRPYQQDAILNTISALDTHGSALVVMATGLGKTVVAAKIAEISKKIKGRPTLLLAHRDTLIEQAVEKFSKWTPLTLAVEQAKDRAHERDVDVVVASVQSISRPERLKLYDKDAFGLIETDEAHHATAASYRTIYNHFNGVPHLGLTATPDRLDKLGLKDTFACVPYRYEIRQATIDGWLAEIILHDVNVQGLDLSNVRTARGDFIDSDLAAAMGTKAMLHATAKALVEMAGSKKTLVFAVDVAHTEALAETLRQYIAPKQVANLTGRNKTEQDEIVLGFREGRTQFLVSCAMLTEGYDDPSIECIAIVRPTKSRALYTQMIGRGTRKHPETGKTRVHVLDFRGNAGRHSLISPVDVLGGAGDPDVRATADEILRHHPQTPVHDAITQALAMVSAEREREALEAIRRAGAKYQHKRLSPFHEAAALLDIVTDPDADDDGGVVTQTAWDMLVKHGVEPSGMSLTQVAAVQHEIFRRINQKLASLKQVRLLAKNGHPHATTVGFAKASELIDQLARNGWYAPSGWGR